MHPLFLSSRLSRWLAMALVAVLSTSAALAQSTANYAFTTNSTGSLVDMSTGTTDALATGTYRDDVASTVQPIGFTFGFMGAAYTQFSVNSNGQLRLGAALISGVLAGPGAGAAILAPLGGDNAIQITGKVHYLLVAGTNRRLVVEWNSLRIPYGAAVAANNVVQAILEENTGKVEYRYGTVINSGAGITRPIFISAGSSAGQIGSVLTFTTTPTYDATVTSATAVALPDNAAVPVLNSAADGARTVFAFTPISGTPVAPGVAISGVGQASLSLAITDNSTNETYFTVSRSTDNTTFTTVATLASAAVAATGGTVTLAQTGLTAGTTYYYRVMASNEAGGMSTNATATATTLAAVPFCGTKSVGPGAGADFPTLTAALASLTINGVCGPLVLELQATYVSSAETFPLVYTYAGTATNTVTVRPATGATGLSITSTVAGAVVNIVGGKYLILDGRPGGSASPVSGAALATDLLISSTSTSGIPVQFTADATFNVVQHTQIAGVGNNVSSYPNVNFTGTTTLGNSDNTLLYNDIKDGATTPVTLVYSGSSLNSRNSIIGNNLSNFYLSGGSAYGLNINTAGTAWVISGNSVYQTASRASTAGTLYGFYIIGGNGHSVTGNFIGGSAPGAGGTALTATGTAAAFRLVGIYLGTSGAATSVQGNTFANINWLSSSGASTTYGIVSGIYVSSGDANIGTVTGNTIGTVAGPVSVSTSTSGGYSFGISSASSGTVSITGNTISNLTGVGSTATVASNVAGILVSAGAANTISRNKIYTLAAGSGVANASTGIWLTGGTTNNVNNNLIGDLQANTSTSLTAVTGLLVSGGTTNNLYFNTINLNATSTGATFGSSGIYLNSTTATLDLRNNIVVNKSTAVGTGGFTAALRRISGTTGTGPANLAATTNNNLYFAGTPSATSVIYVEGTTTATNAQQTLVAYKGFAGTREQLSVTEDVPFLSTTGTAATFLHISTTVATQVESGASPIASITTDFDGDTRSTTAPDLGADEGTFLPLDLSGPVITYTALGNINSTANRTLTVTITDASGVGTGTGAPLLYFRKNSAGAYQSGAATSVSGSSYTFTFDYTALGGVASGDVVQYYVAAQDALGNMSTSPGGGSGATPPGTTAPASVNSFLITGTLAGTYYVGTGTSPNPARTYATLTAAVNTYNLYNLGGAVTFALLDATYSASETFPLIIGSNADASAVNTLTIKPNTGVSSTISGTNATAILALNGADYVTIDGSNGGTISATDPRPSRNLTVTNTNPSTTSFVVLVTVPSATDNATNNTVKNLNAVGSGAAATQVGIAFLSATGSTAGNNNNLVQNNTVRAAQYGIYSFGVSATVKNTGTVITQNDLNATGPAALGRVGIVVGFEDGIQITRNAIDGIVFTGGGDVLGISAGFGLVISTSTFTGSEVTNATITRNNIGVVRQTGTYSAIGIGLASAASGTSVIANNFVSGVSANGTGGDFGGGIFVGGGTGSTTRVAFNSVNMTGTQTGGNYPSFALAIGGVSPVVDIRNNILLNTQTTGSGNSVALGFAYAGTAGAYSGLTSSNNDFFVGTGATFAVAQTGSLSTSGVLRTTLAALNTETGQDAPATSKTVDPAFASATDLHTASVALNNAGVPVTGITVDFDGEVRSTTTPDIGADEFTPQTVDVAAAALVAPTAATCYSTAEAVTVSIRNAGAAALDFSVNPALVTAVVTLPGGTLRTLTNTLTTGTLAIGATQNVTLTGTLDMSAVGTYSFAVTATVTGDGNTANDALTPTPTRTVAAPVAGTLAPATATICVSGTVTLTLTGAANGGIQYQSSTSATGTFTDIAGATSASFTTPVLTSTTYYRAQVRCNTGTATSNVSTVTVNNPLVASSNTPVGICSGSTATLTATASAGSSIRFFGNSTGGTALATAAAGSYTTPALTANTTYYAEAYSGGTETAGRTLPSVTTGFVGTATGLVFTTTSGVSIQSATVYPVGTGTITFALYDNAGVELAATAALSVTGSGLSTPVSVPLNLTVPAAGTGYRLLVKAFTGITDLLRENPLPAGSAFPFTSPSGIFSITGGYNAAPVAAYYYFYALNLSSECVGATRTAILVNVTATPATPTVTVSYPTRSTALLTSSVAPAGTTYQWYFGTSAITGATSQTYTANGATAAGTYTVRFIATAGGCQSAASTTVTVTASAQPLAGSSLHLFPNPTTDGQLTLQLSGYSKAVQLTVLDALGRVVLTKQVAAGQTQTQLDLSGAARGLYTLRAITEGGTDIRRIVRE